MQNHPIPLAAHLQRLQSSCLVSFGVQTCPLVCTCSSSPFVATNASSTAGSCNTAGAGSSLWNDSGTQNFLVHDISLPSAEQRHLLHSTMKLLPGSHTWPPSNASAPTTSTVVISSNDLIASFTPPSAASFVLIQIFPANANFSSRSLPATLQTMQFRTLALSRKHHLTTIASSSNFLIDRSIIACQRLGKH